MQFSIYGSAGLSVDVQTAIPVSVPEENAAETCPKVQSFINILTLCDESTLNIDWWGGKYLFYVGVII